MNPNITIAETLFQSAIITITNPTTDQLQNFAITLQEICNNLETIFFSERCITLVFVYVPNSRIDNSRHSNWLSAILTPNWNYLHDTVTEILPIRHGFAGLAVL